MGQDGTLMRHYLSANRPEIEVILTSRSEQIVGSLNSHLVSPNHSAVKLQPSNCNEVFKLIEAVKPDRLFLLAGQSSVGKSYLDPQGTISSTLNLTLNVLEAIRLHSPATKIFFASSSECFGNTNEGRCADEESVFNPQSPYAAAKAQATSLIRFYRDHFDIFAVCGFLFNHESVYRKKSFVLWKIIDAVQELRHGNTNPVEFGRLDIERDWGYAPEYVEGMWRSLDSVSPTDFIFATGKVASLEKFISGFFEFYGLNWENKILSSPNMFRSNEPDIICGDPCKAMETLSWKPQTDYLTLPGKLLTDFDRAARHKVT